MAANAPPPPEAMSVDEFRRSAYAALAVSGEPEEMAAVEDVHIEAAAGRVGARRYVPLGEPEGLLVYFHGGGFVRGDLETHDPLCRRLARAAECELLARGLPARARAPLPRRRGGRPRGAGLHRARTGAGRSPWAATARGATWRRSRRCTRATAGAPALAAQVLLYPVTDATMASPSLDELAEGRMLTKAALAWMYDRYLPAGADRTDPRASPLLAERHEGVAPAVIVTAGNDPLRDDGIRYAERLEDACVYVDHLAYDGTIHSFMLYAGALPTGMEAAASVGAALRELLRTPRNSA